MFHLELVDCGFDYFGSCVPGNLETVFVGVLVGIRSIMLSRRGVQIAEVLLTLMLCSAFIGLDDSYFCFYHAQLTIFSKMLHDMFKKEECAT